MPGQLRLSAGGAGGGSVRRSGRSGGMMAAAAAALLASSSSSRARCLAFAARPPLASRSAASAAFLRAGGGARAPGGPPVRRRGWLALSASTASAAKASAEAASTGTAAAASPPSPHADYDPRYDETNRSRGIVGKYDPSSFESDIYRWWEGGGCFDPDAKKSAEEERGKEEEEKKPYVLPMPPPNVTGRLHMGHAIFVALQDVLARFHRMRGRPVLWLPGTDHAGIATQLQVEKQLLSEGTSREEVGRDEFLRRVWSYKEEQGGHITRQLRSLGASADWSRERFTMDPDLSDAVTEAFVRLHERGLVYRGEYMVNWAPLLRTAVSDLEVEYAEEEGRLYYFKYVVEGGGSDDEYLPVATTRPETIVGDAAVCVHPDDERYGHLIGRRAVVPMSGGRTVPIIADEYVDMEFGTGALKVTPGHDPNDYALGKKYGLPVINVMNKDGTMNAEAGPAYDGLDRFECRERLWADMEGEGLTIKDEPHVQRVPRSQRGGEVIEPLVSSQWFVRTEGMGAKALRAVEEGDIRIVPERFAKTWSGWLTDVHDWCVSRQLWWGHRIPVWYVGDAGEGEYVVARNEDEARQKAMENGHPIDVVLRQEEDVLDTWFSSGLWPFATVGWPGAEDEEGPTDLSRFYPGTCLETGYDILFFWVARMAMMGIELTGRAPFEVVYLHGLVRAPDGSKMSKTKGNVVDPLDTVGKYGADSLRYSLVTGVTPGQDIPLNMEKIESSRNFANKLWNCCRFVTDNALRDADDEELSSLGFDSSGPMSAEELSSLRLPERYVVSECHDLVASVTSDVESYSLGSAGSRVYEFLWDKFADWYIEISKTRLYEGAGGGKDEDDARSARRVLVYVLDVSLRLLHPYMPYVTEQLWHHLPRPSSSSSSPEGGEGDVDGDDGGRAAAPRALMLADWPQMDDASPLPVDPDAVSAFESFQALTRGIRNARAEYNVEPGKKISASIVASGPLREAIEAEVMSLAALARLDVDSVAVYEAGSEGAEEAAEVESVKVVAKDGAVAYLPLSGLIDPVKERRRLERRGEKVGKEMEKLAGRLRSKGFIDKAPPAVVDRARAELAELEDQAAKIRSSLDALPN